MSKVSKVLEYFIITEHPPYFPEIVAIGYKLKNGDCAWFNPFKREWVITRRIIHTGIKAPKFYEQEVNLTKEIEANQI